MVKIVLTNGTTLNNLSKNGDNFIARYAINPGVFENNLSPVTITEDDQTTTHDHMALEQLIQRGNEIWFVLRDLTQDELRYTKLQADLEYIAMMADVEL